MTKYFYITSQMPVGYGQLITTSFVLKCESGFFGKEAIKKAITDEAKKRWSAVEYHNKDWNIMCIHQLTEQEYEFYKNN